MEIDKLNKITADLQNRFPEAGIMSIEVDESSGQSTIHVAPTTGNERQLAYLTDTYGKTSSSVFNRDAISRDNLDLSASKDSYSDTPLNLFKKAIRYYYTEPLVGSTVDMYSSIAAKGFEIDVEDDDVKYFYENWLFDVNFEDVLEWIFTDLFRTSHVTTYKYVAKYEPQLTTIPKSGKTQNKINKKELAAKKKLWSNSELPLGYTVLNPLLVSINGNLLFDKTSTVLRIPEELKELWKKSSTDRTYEENQLLKDLPANLRKAIKTGDDLLLDPDLVGSVTYKKMPYEKYARPRLARVFDSIEYKRALRNADLSTLDGVVNFILKITVGNDEFPVTSPEELEAVAKLFVTDSKAYEIVWNHTLEIERISSNDVEHILGKGKYEQVNEDLTSGLSITKAIIDGSAAGDPMWAIKGMKETIDYARRQVTKWIYKEFRLISNAMGFDVIPSVRWNEEVLKDEILYKNVIAQLVDRRMLSYETALESLGYNFDVEKSQMEAELPLVEEGIFGIHGSPFQQTTQTTQEAPTGTPSNGRPTGQTNTKTKETDPNNLQDNKASVDTIVASIHDMSSMEKQKLIDILQDNHEK